MSSSLDRVQHNNCQAIVASPKEPRHNHSNLNAKHMRTIALYFVILLLTLPQVTFSASSYVPHNSIPIWPALAPGEKTSHPGIQQPFRKGEHPPVLRIHDITQPRLQIFLPHGKSTKTGILILPGGGYGKVVTNKEGSEAAQWLNDLGIAAFVLSYRTSLPQDNRPWFRPLQDSQRALRLIRSNANKWNLKRDQIGLLGFSAGGQLAAIHMADQFPTSYDLADKVDTINHLPDFVLLVYPWNTTGPSSSSLKEEIQFSKPAPPTFIVHTDDDRSTSLGSLAIYSTLKGLGTPTELHVYENGGHGYGMRTVAGSNIGTWPMRAAEWLHLRKLGSITP